MVSPALLSEVVGRLFEVAQKTREHELPREEIAAILEAIANGMINVMENDEEPER